MLSRTQFWRSTRSLLLSKDRQTLTAGTRVFLSSKIKMRMPRIHETRIHSTLAPTFKWGVVAVLRPGQAESLLPLF